MGLILFVLGFAFGLLVGFFVRLMKKRVILVVYDRYEDVLELFRKLKV